MLLKYLIPFDRFVIQSRLSTIAAAQALQAAIEPKKYFRLFDRGSKEFEGTIAGAGFKINRLIRYNNSFLPIIIGTIEPAPMGCAIHIRMRMMVFINIFCVVWFGGVVSISCAFFPQYILAAQGKESPMVFIPFGMMAFFLALVNGGFWVEANKQKAILQRIFDART